MYGSSCFQGIAQPGTLYIVDAQYEYAGRYDCVAKTTQDEVSAGATFTVEGMFYLRKKNLLIN